VSGCTYRAGCLESAGRHLSSWGCTLYGTQRLEGTVNESEQLKRKLTHSEAGRLGGLKIVEKHGKAYLGELAKAGDKAILEARGREFFQEIGRKGGSTNRVKHGIAHFSDIGQLGGEATKTRYGSEHFARIGRIGGSSHRVKTNHERPQDGAA
jgi:uncharacterized protein